MPLVPVATDDFSAYGTNTQLAASANWDNAFGTGWIVRSSARVEVDPGAPSGPTADYWVGAGTFTANQYSQIDMTAGSSGATYGGPAVRIDPTGDNCYWLVGSETDTSGPYLERVDAASATTLASYGIDGWDVADQIRLEAEGTTLRSYLNGALLGSTTDATYATGSVGLGGINDGSSFPRYDNWVGGNITAAGGSLPPHRHPMAHMLVR